jgi:hypothetical protein
MDYQDLILFYKKQPMFALIADGPDGVTIQPPKGGKIPTDLLTYLQHAYGVKITSQNLVNYVLKLDCEYIDRDKFLVFLEQWIKKYGYAVSIIN